jgi:hypothetical protein
MMSLRLRKGLTHAGYVKTGEEVYPCHFTNMSGTGAIVIFDGPIDLPDRFTVRLAPDGRVERDCTVLWSEGTQIGISFTAGQ